LRLSPKPDDVSNSTVKKLRDLIVQIGFNLYPILHLRWVRIRINRLQDTVTSKRLNETV
jgi:hypothetical protein